MTKKLTWERVGSIGVDAGLCWIGDPCYVVSKDATDAWEDWDSFCSELFSKQKITGDASIGDFGTTGVAVSTGYGDGMYDVFVRRTPNGRIKEAKIIFIDEDEDGDDEW